MCVDMCVYIYVYMYNGNIYIYLYIYTCSYFICALIRYLMAISCHGLKFLGQLAQFCCSYECSSSEIHFSSDFMVFLWDFAWDFHRKHMENGKIIGNQRKMGIYPRVTEQFAIEAMAQSK